MVFLDSTINIKVQFYCGYTLDTIAMNEYLPNLFDNYQFISDQDNTGVGLVIHLTQITLPNYEITFHFKNVDVISCDPTISVTSSTTQPTISMDDYLQTNSIASAPSIVPRNSGNTYSNNKAKTSTAASLFSNYTVLISVLTFGTFVIANVYLHTR